MNTNHSFTAKASLLSKQYSRESHGELKARELAKKLLDSQPWPKEFADELRRIAGIK